MKKSTLHLLIFLILLSIWKKEPLTLFHSISNSDYEVVKTTKKDNTIYTQGLFFSNDSKHLYESGGLYKESKLIQYSYPLMTKDNEIEINEKYFAEGIAVCYSAEDKQSVLFQLTYNEKVVLKYSYPSLKYLGTISMDDKLKEGWGLSSYKDSNELIATDGSDRMFVLNCDDNLKVINSIPITNENKPLNRLNELTYANGFIYANRYFDHSVYKINPLTGKVIKAYDMSQLAIYEMKHHQLTNDNLNKGDVLNGIAYNSQTNTFLLTGKRWSNYYSIKFLK